MDLEPGMPADRPPSRPMALRVLAFLVLALVLTGLVAFAVLDTPNDNDTRSATAGLPDLQQELAAHQWLLDPADSSLASDDPNPVTLVFGDDVVSGNGPCNIYSGRLSLDDDDDTLAITELAQTNRACDPSTMDAEREYFAALENVREIDLDDAYNARDLVLSNDTGDRLAFDAINTRDLVIGTWQVVNVARDDAIESVVVGTEPTLQFNDDGTVLIETGCNSGDADWNLEGDALTIESVVVTERACDVPPGVADQEQALLAALESAEQAEVTPDTLTILDADDHITLIATAAGS